MLRRASTESASPPALRSERTGTPAPPEPPLRRAGVRRRALRVLAVPTALVLLASPVRAAVPVSLDQVPIPRPTGPTVPVPGGKLQSGTHALAEVIPPEKEAAAVRLGKALFWDVQVGSAGDVACATCHFKAGTDGRVTNTVHAGPDGVFALATPNGTLRAASFPLSLEIDDVVGAQGVPRANFSGLRPGTAEERAQPVADPTFRKLRRNVRQVTGRNSPSVINAVFNVTNFHDGRANHFFNGVNPFGPQDPDARVWVDDGAGLQPLRILLNNSSLASQAVGPPLNEVEMSWLGKSFPELGRKLLPLAPLGGQAVHPNDSVLASLAQSRMTGDRQAKGLATTYRQMIEAAFAPRFWSSQALTPDGYTLMEANFPLFFGLAIQMYESTLVSDDTPFDRFLKGQTAALTPRQQVGLNVFFSDRAACADCHTGPELTAATFTQLLAPDEPGFIEVMPMADGVNSNYDIGFYHIGVRPSAEDPGRGGATPFDSPLSFSRQSALKAGLTPVPDGPGEVNFDPTFIPAPGCVPDPFAVPTPRLCPPTPNPRVAVDGAFKTPSLRNVELTGPYFHNGGKLTLRQVVDFYDRGGDFRGEPHLLAPVMKQIGFSGEDGDALIDFLTALTDDRVRWEKAPFDHPELPLPDGHALAPAGHPKRHGGAALPTRFTIVPAVGAEGRAAEGIGPLRPFLWDGTTDFHWAP